MIFFTSSWDDGSIYDLKLSELLVKYEHRATFYIPLNNIEGRSVINHSQIRELSKNFEIGAHTINHVYLNRIPIEDAKKEIEQSKIELELITGNPVHGFCFPGGKYTRKHLEIVKQVGFNYARTIKTFTTNNDNNLVGTTLQAFDHSTFTYIKNLLTNLNINGFKEYSTYIFNRQWDNLLIKILKKHIAKDSEGNITIIHLWGHSYEIEENNQWSRLENFLQLINHYQIKTKTNYEITNSTLLNN